MKKYCDWRINVSFSLSVYYLLCVCDFVDFGCKKKTNKPKDEEKKECLCHTFYTHIRHPPKFFFITSKPSYYFYVKHMVFVDKWACLLFLLLLFCSSSKRSVHIVLNHSSNSNSKCRLYAIQSCWQYVCACVVLFVCDTITRVLDKTDFYHYRIGTPSTEISWYINE